MTATATLAGIPLLAIDSVPWRFTQGVTPFKRSFEVSKARAKAMLDAAPAGREVDLIVTEPGRPTLHVKGIYILSVQSSSHPDRVNVLVADRREWWDRKFIRREYNIRRQSGEMRLVEGNLERVTSLPDVTFAKYSLKDEQRAWTAKEILEDVLKEVTDNKFSMGDADFSKAIDVDGFQLQDDGQDAIRRCLDLVPGLAVFLDHNGVATLTMTTGGGEEKELKKAGPAVVGPDLITLVDMRRPRPKKIEVYFQPENEVRFDLTEGYTFTSSEREPRIWRNVLRLPDRRLTISGKVVAQNTWVEINQALLDAWNNDTASPPVVRVGGGQIRLQPLSFEIIQRLWMSPGGYHGYLEVDSGQTDQVWVRRWNAIMHSYRQTYQIDRRWRDRVRWVRAERIAVIDPENARRAPADIFSDHAVIPSVKRIVKNRGDTTKKLAFNKPAWDSVNDSTRLLSAAHLAESCILVPVDEAQMVFQAVFRPDSQGNTIRIIPSLLADKSIGSSVDIPSADPRGGPGALFMLSQARLYSKHRFSSVMTLQPASPQGLKGLVKIEISPEEAKRALPEAIAKRIGPCEGPPLQTFIPPGIIPAGFAWKDDQSANIVNAILDGGPHVGSLLVYPLHLFSVAQSAAAVIYSLFADRLDGSHVTAYNPSALPWGRIATVSHELGRRGSMITRMEMPPVMKGQNLRALLPEDVRRLVFGTVQL